MIIEEPDGACNRVSFPVAGDCRRIVYSWSNPTIPANFAAGGGETHPELP
jgi:hypothetical protein